MPDPTWKEIVNLYWDIEEFQRELGWQVRDFARLRPQALQLAERIRAVFSRTPDPRTGAETTEVTHEREPA